MQLSIVIWKFMKSISKIVDDQAIGALVAGAMLYQMRQVLLQVLQFDDFPLNLVQVLLGDAFNLGTGPILVFIQG
jgi:hypothetical protein|tara:strand:- start:529 stop:753 length:225 start_codon:yes stop_codon:yes gene_type:complete